MIIYEGVALPSECRVVMNMAAFNGGFTCLPTDGSSAVPKYGQQASLVGNVGQPVIFLPCTV